MPFLEQIRREQYAEVDMLIERLDEHAERPDRTDIVAQLVDCPQPLKPTLSRRFAAASPHQPSRLQPVSTLTMSPS